MKGPGAAVPAPIIVTATLGPADFAWADALRREHFPPERNQLAAHLTLFHHLPPSSEAELRRALSDACRASPPRATLEPPYSLGSGVAYRIASDELAANRAQLADRFEGMLTPQDRQGWRAHVTVQNKVKAEVARALLAELSLGFRVRPIAIVGLAAWWYRGGPWEAIGSWSFRGG